VTELGEEAVQQATNPFIQELGAAITDAIPDRPEGQKLKDVMAQFMETATSFLWRFPSSRLRDARRRRFHTQAMA